MLTNSINFEIVPIDIFNFVAKLQKFIASPLKFVVVVPEFSIFKLKKYIEFFVWSGNENKRRPHIPKNIKNNFIDEI